LAAGAFHWGALWSPNWFQRKRMRGGKEQGRNNGEIKTERVRRGERRK